MIKLIIELIICLGDAINAELYMICSIRKKLDLD